jgi:hypothetical protein
MKNLNLLKKIIKGVILKMNLKHLTDDELRLIHFSEHHQSKADQTAITKEWRTRYRWRKPKQLVLRGF